MPLLGLTLQPSVHLSDWALHCFPSSREKSAPLIPPVSLSTLFPSRHPFLRKQQTQAASESGPRGRRARQTVCLWVRDTPHRPQPHGGRWASTKAAGTCFSFTLDDTESTNDYWPLYRPQPSSSRVCGYIASLGQASAGRGGSKATGAQAAGRHLWSHRPARSW